MAECKDVDAALASLENKLNLLLKRLAQLEKDCKSNKNSNEAKPFDPSAILKRLNDIEKYINSLDRELTTFKNQLEQLFRDTKDFAKYLIDFLKIILALFV